MNGERSASVAPGRAVSLRVAVAPGVGGRVSVEVERFDPLAGWQYLRRYRLRSAEGRALVAFRPPAVGRFRARARFLGTRTASPSESGWSTLRVAGPLRP